MQQHRSGFESRAGDLANASIVLAIAGAVFVGAALSIRQGDVTVLQRMRKTRLSDAKVSMRLYKVGLAILGDGM